MARKNDMVKVKVSKMKGKIGEVVSVGKNPVLPIAVVFENSKVEWDFKEEDVEVMEMTQKKLEDE